MLAGQKFWWIKFENIIKSQNMIIKILKREALILKKKKIFIKSFKAFLSETFLLFLYCYFIYKILIFLS